MKRSREQRPPAATVPELTRRPQGTPICNFNHRTRKTFGNGIDAGRLRRAFSLRLRALLQHRLGGTQVAALAHLTNCPRLHSRTACREEETVCVGRLLWRYCW